MSEAWLGGEKLGCGSSCLGTGHYGEVCKVIRRSDGEEFALKTITKKRPIYVEILKSEVSILSVRAARRCCRHIHQELAANARNRGQSPPSLDELAVW